MTPAPGTSGAERARAWVAHLSSGGTTSWQAWRAGGTPSRDPSDPSDPSDPGDPSDPVEPLVLLGGFLPGAQQLELLRRTTLVAGHRLPAELSERVLRASPYGRGLPDLPLPGGAAPPFGPPPVDPGALAAGELLRYASLLLADRIAELAAQRPAAPSVGGGRPRLLRRGYRLVGDPWAAPALRAALTRRGLPPGGRRPQVHVLAGPLEVLLASTWTHRVLTGTPPAWPTWVAEVAGRRRGGLPPGADAVGTARVWADRVGVGRVSVVTRPAEAARLLSPRRLGRRDPVDVPVPLPADAVELVRQVRGALEVVSAPEVRTDLVTRELVPLLAALPSSGDAARLGVPDQHRRWVRRRSERVRRRLLGAGYAVEGQPDDLLVGSGGTPPGALPSPEGVLRVACEVLVADAEGGRVR